METKEKITRGTAGLFALLTIILGANLIYQDDVYVCEDKQISLVCDKLSKVNEGIQTRCYFFSEELNRSTYKICNTGWIKFETNRVYQLNATDEFLICDEGELIRECISETGKLILRVKNE